MPVGPPVCPPDPSVLVHLHQFVRRSVLPVCIRRSIPPVCSRWPVRTGPSAQASSYGPAGLLALACSCWPAHTDLFVMICSLIHLVRMPANYSQPVRASCYPKTPWPRRQGLSATAFEPVALVALPSVVGAPWAPCVLQTALWGWSGAVGPSCMPAGRKVARHGLRA